MDLSRGLGDVYKRQAVHHRCIRLIRVSIEAIYLGNLQAGQVRELEEVDFFKLLDL
jgi:23S rRNA pseudouridine2457 synthase